MYNLSFAYNRKHLATYILVAVTTLYWLVQFFTFGSQVSTGISVWTAGAVFGNGMTSPLDLWRLFTPIFVHVSWPHIAMNMLTLLLIGRLIEEIFGSFRLAAIYLLSGIFANASIFCLQPNSLSAGASTAIFGIFGAISTLGYFTSDPRLKEIGKSFIALIVINLAINLFQPDVSLMGHIGGVVAGALLAAIFPPKAYVRWIPRKVRLIAGILFFGLLCVFIVSPFILR